MVIMDREQERQEPTPRLSKLKYSYIRPNYNSQESGYILERLLFLIFITHPEF